MKLRTIISSLEPAIIFVDVSAEMQIASADIIGKTNTSASLPNISKNRNWVAPCYPDTICTE
jgi:hypothetical protein